jgi:hypothetical protein
LKERGLDSHAWRPCLHSIASTSGAKPARAMVRFGADIPGVLVAVEAIALA